MRAPTTFPSYHSTSALRLTAAAPCLASHTICDARVTRSLGMLVAVINGCALSEFVVCNFNKHYRRTHYGIYNDHLRVYRRQVPHTHTHSTMPLGRNSLHFTFVRLHARTNQAIFLLFFISISALLFSIFFSFAHLKKSRAHII